MDSFSDNYLKSDFCMRAMDSSYSRFQLADEEECWDFIAPEIEKDCKKLDEGAMFDPAVAFWIGFMYRYICRQTGIRSNVLRKYVSYPVMCQYYPGLHTIDEDNAVEIVKKDFIPADESDG